MVTARLSMDEDPHMGPGVSLGWAQPPTSSASPRQAVHKTVLTFNDEATKTARNSSLSKRALSKIPVIRFNRPFIVIVKDEYTSVPLFVGKVTNPTENS